MTTCPGDYVHEELVARGLTRDEFRRWMGWGVNQGESFFSGQKRLLVSEAEAFGRFFGTSAEVWLGLDRRYREAQP